MVKPHIALSASISVAPVTRLQGGPTAEHGSRVFDNAPQQIDGKIEIL
jgi:hypothetical protein